MLELLDSASLPLVLRRTVLVSLGIGVLAVLVALFAFDSLPASLGIALGLGLALVNFRFLDAAVARTEASGQSDRKIVRRLIASRTFIRLGVVTVVVVALLVLVKVVALGAAVGLVLFQLAYIASVYRALARADAETEVVP